MQNIDTSLPVVTTYGRAIPDQYVMDRESKYLHEDDDCIRPGGCPGTLQPIREVIEGGDCRKGHEDWLMCDKCGMRYMPIQGLGYVWADAGYYGYSIGYKEA